MLEVLKDKVLSWTQQKADTFHNFTFRDSIEGCYIWESDKDGLYLYRDVTSTYLQYNGTVYKISKWFEDHDWQMHCRLYEECLKKNIRIDIPLHSETFTMLDSKWIYLVVQRPNNEIGNDIYLDIFNNNISNDYFLEYIDQAAILTEIFKNLSLMYNFGCPEVGIPPTKRLRDNNGFFWVDFKRWKLDLNKFIDRNLNDIVGITSYINKNIPTFDLNVDMIKKHSEKQWNILRK